MSKKYPDIEREKEELKMVSEFVGNLANVIPNIVKGVLEGLFSEETGGEMGKAVGAFYKGLTDAGVPEAKAVEMAGEYLGTLTKWPEILKRLEGIKGVRIGPEGIRIGPKGVKAPTVPKEQIVEEIRKEVKEQIEKALKKSPQT